MLAKDGTINRARSGVADSTNKDFFMGVTTDKLFEDLMKTVSSDLLSYCGQPSNSCDTSKQTCNVKFSFLVDKSSIECEYCTNGNLNDLPSRYRNKLLLQLK